MTLRDGFNLRKLIYAVTPNKRSFDRWTGECWNCGNYTFTFFKVKNGYPYEQLQTDFKYLPQHEFRAAEEELEYLFSDGWEMWKTPHVRQRAKVALDTLNRLIEDKIKTKKSDDGAIDDLIKTDEWKDENVPGFIKEVKEKIEEINEKSKTA